MKYLNENDVKNMLVGSLIYSTGGGIEYEVQKKLFKQLFSKYKKLPLITINELDDNDCLCTAYSVGSAGNTNVDLSKALKIGIEKLQYYTKKEFKAIFAGETNIDILAFQTALQLQLPVLDADATGGRAVPELQFDNFAVVKKSTLPLVAVLPNFKTILISKIKNLSKVDKIIQSLLLKHKQGLIVVLDHYIQVKEAKKILTLGIFERAIELGEFISKNSNHKNFERKMIKYLQGKIIIKGKVTKINIKNEDGFLNGYYHIIDRKNNLVKIFVKNENLICWKNNKMIVVPPDFIITLNAKTFHGIHNSSLKLNQEVIVIKKRASKFWNTKNARKLFNPKYFGFPI